MPPIVEKSSSPLERLNRLWLPVTGFIGAVVVIVQFVELWRGNKGLVTWVTICLGYLALLSTIWHFAFSKKQSPIDSSRRISAYPSIAKYAQITLGIVILVTIIASWILLWKSTPAKMADSTISSNSTLVQECQGVEVYLLLDNLGSPVFNGKSGQKRPKRVDERN